MMMTTEERVARICLEFNEVALMQECFVKLTDLLRNEIDEAVAEEREGCAKMLETHTIQCSQLADKHPVTPAQTDIYRVMGHSFLDAARFIRERNTH
jgi:hypothetical protein